MTDFVLDPRLDADTLVLTDWPLCRVLLANDSRFPWLILVPRIAGAVEIVDLPEAARAALSAEIDRAARALRKVTACDKLNIAALGNMVAQLHVHVIARRRGDAAWPKPVWGLGDPTPYAPNDAAVLRLRQALQP